MERKQISHINEYIQNETQVVINCSGLYARTLGGIQDSNVYPVRGCTVNAQFDKVFDKGFIRRHNNGAMTYLIPRDDGTACIGGTFVSIFCEFISQNSISYIECQYILGKE